MIPLFKSHYSLGKSILTLKLPADKDSAGADSVFDILKENNLSRLVLVEDTMAGFLEAYNNCKQLGIKLVFGLRLIVCNEASSYEKGDCLHKIIIFARTPQGIHLLTKLYSIAFTQYEGKIDLASLKEIFTQKDLRVYIPFYDSFLHSNLTSYSKPCVANFSSFKPVFFIENNSLPFDNIIKDAVMHYCEEHDLQTLKAKSIFYKDRKDFEAYQTYKCICNRSYSGRQASLTKPNLDHCASPEFCFESYAHHEVS